MLHNIASAIFNASLDLDSSLSVGRGGQRFSLFDVLHSENASYIFVAYATCYNETSEAVLISANHSKKGREKNSLSEAVLFSA